jgi:hypothetical protein
MIDQQMVMCVAIFAMIVFNQCKSQKSFMFALLHFSISKTFGNSQFEISKLSRIITNLSKVDNIKK